MNRIRRGTKPALIILIVVVSVAFIGAVVAQDQYQGVWTDPGMMSDASGFGMMNSGFFLSVIIVCALLLIVWLIAGILLIIWLLRQLQKEQSVS